MKTISIRNYSRGASWVLILYLSIMMSGCTPRPMVLPPEEARLLQTRDFEGTPDEVAKAISKVLQDMNYTVDHVDMDLGILTASKTSERPLAPISQVASADNDFKKGLGTFFIVAGTIAIVGLVFAWIFDVFDNDNDNDRDRRQSRHSRRSHAHHNDSGIYIFGSDHSDTGADSYSYLMTINLEETSNLQTQVRLSVEGEHYTGASIVESGPVQDQQFYIDIFNRIYAMLNG